MVYWVIDRFVIVKSYIPSLETLPEGYGFMNEVGSHTSRTIMRKELEALLNSTPVNTTFNDLKKLVIEDNILQKKDIWFFKTTLFTRSRSTHFSIIAMGMGSKQC